MECLLARVFCSYITLYEQAQVRLPRYALNDNTGRRLPRRSAPRNDRTEFTAMTTYCHSEERGKAP